MSNVVARMPHHHCKQEPVPKLGFQVSNSAAVGHQILHYFGRAQRGQSSNALSNRLMELKQVLLALYNKQLESMCKFKSFIYFTQHLF